MFFKALVALFVVSFIGPLLLAEERTWTDSTGKYEFVASLVEVNDDGVLLKQANGKTKLVPLAKLSKTVSLGTTSTHPLTRSANV